MQISFRYPEYPATESFEIGEETYVPVYLSSHPDDNKIYIHFDTYNGRAGSSTKRVGKAFKVSSLPYKEYAEFVVDNRHYVMDLESGRIAELGYFNKTVVKGESISPLTKQDTVLKDLLRGDEQFRFQMLGRLEADCKYFLGYGNRNENRLWAHNTEDQILYMKALYLSFGEADRPKWISLEKIKKYEKEMKKII